MEQKPLKELLEFSIIIIDKPSGPTSFNVSEHVKKKMGVRKTSHFGTLDPKVTGVLPVALNRACKLTGFFLGHDKEYVGVMNVHKEISLEKLQKIIDENFTGKIKQTPPKRSRVKRQEREREIKKFELLEKKGKDFLFLAEVQGGTYIRKLIHDLGEKNDVQGAHMTELRRIRAGIFKEQQSKTLYEFKEAVEEYKEGKEDKLRKMLIPAEQAVKEIMPFVELNQGADLRRVLSGKPLFSKDVISKLPQEEKFAVFLGERFIGIYVQFNDTINQGENKIIAKALFVLQPLGNKTEK